MNNSSIIMNVMDIENSIKAAVIKSPIPFSSCFSGSSDSIFAAYLELTNRVEIEAFK